MKPKPPPLSDNNARRLADLKAIVRRTAKSFIECGVALREIQEENLWIEYPSFKAFCFSEFGLSDRHARRIMDGAQAALELPEQLGHTCPPLSGRAATALAAVPKENRPEVFQQAAKNGEVTAKAIEQAAKFIPEPDEYVDAMGYPIPCDSTKFWDMADEVKSLRNELRRIKALIVAAAEATPKMFVESNVQAITIHLQNAFSDLGNSIPYAVCPSCQGQNAGKCQLCRGRGLISKFRWNVTVPEELKTLRQKQIAKLK